MAPSGDFEGQGKKPRFDFQGGGGGGEGDDPSSPATLRVLIRNSDAGGIIGKARRNELGWIIFLLLPTLFFCCRVETISNDFGNRCVYAGCV